MTTDDFFSAPEDEVDFRADSAPGLDEGSAPLPDASTDGEPHGVPATVTDGYWSVSRTPLTSLVFSLPLVLAYEGGVLVLGHGTPRNGADVWLRHALDGLGFGSYFLLPILTAIGLLAWHHVAHDRWRFSPAILLGMAAECLLWAVVLIGLARMLEGLWPPTLDADFRLAAGVAEGPLAGLFGRFVGYCGAGLYEEVLFRLLLLPAIIWLVKKAGVAGAGAWGIVLTSLLFSGAHYVGPLGDAFTLYSFAFRALAGIFFSLLFLARGFGIAAGTHAAYDFLVGLL